LPEGRTRVRGDDQRRNREIAPGSTRFNSNGAPTHRTFVRIVPGERGKVRTVPLRFEATSSAG
jgi:hypothetical protein